LLPQWRAPVSSRGTADHLPHEPYPLHRVEQLRSGRLALGSAALLAPPRTYRNRAITVLRGRPRSPCPPMTRRSPRVLGRSGTWPPTLGIPLSPCPEPTPPLLQFPLQPADLLVVVPQLLPQPADLLLHPQQPLVLFVQQVGQTDATRASPSCTLPGLPTPRPHGPNKSAGNRTRQLFGMPRGPVGPGRRPPR